MFFCDKKNFVWFKPILQYREKSVFLLEFWLEKKHIWSCRTRFFSMFLAAFIVGNKKSLLTMDSKERDKRKEKKSSINAQNETDEWQFKRESDISKSFFSAYSSSVRHFFSLFCSFSFFIIPSKKSISLWLCSANLLFFPILAYLH